MTTKAKIIVTAAFVAVPGALFAGGYGESAVKDARVGQVGPEGDTVYCQRLDQEIPERLASRMDCGGAVARPRVAGERTSSGILGALNEIFGGGGSGGNGGSGGDDTRGTSDGDDGDRDNNGGGGSGGGGGGSGGGDGGSGGGDGGSGGGDGGSGGGDGGSGGGSGGGDGGSGGGDGGSGGGDFTSKWDRLADFGVNRDNYKDQDRGLLDQIKDFRQENGSKGDWSGFNPTSN